MTARVVICGAGQVGYNIARYLSYYDVHVTCIDTDRDLVTKLSERLDIQAICGSASHPGVLERAGVKGADVFLAVTRIDEVNMVACELAHALFEAKTKIARIRSKAYLDPKWKRIFDPGNLSVDAVISPELEVAKFISNSLSVPGAFSVYTLCDGHVQVVGVRCTMDTPVVNTPLTHIASLFPEVELTVLGIVRGDSYIIPTEDEILRKEDEIYFCCATTEVHKAMQAFISNPNDSSSIIILGGGHIGLALAQEIEKTYPKTAVRIIEMDKQRAEDISRELNHSVVIYGDALESEVLKEAGVLGTELVVAVTADDRVNTFSSLLAKRHGARHVQALVNNRSYAPLVTSLGVDAVINPRAISVSRILEHIRQGNVCGVHSIREGFGEVIEVDIPEGSNLVGATLNEISFPGELAVGAVVRGETILSPTGDITFQQGDKVVIMVSSHMIPKMEKLLSEQITYF